MHPNELARLREEIRRELVEKIRQLSHPDGYFARFHHFYGQNLTQYEAWELLEAERQEYGLPPRHSTFAGFQMGLYRNILKVRRH